MLIVWVIVAASAIVVAAVLGRRGAASTSPTSLGTTPDHLARRDFVAPDSPWLIVAFTSSTCLACGTVVDQIGGFETASTAVQVVPVETEPDLHRRYGIDSVPTTVAVDADGVTRGAWLGPLAPADRSDLAALTGLS